MIEAQRGALYKVLGKEPADGGVDLLAEFADLADDVKEARITRERALELASARRERAANEARSKQQQTRQQSVDQQKKASETASPRSPRGPVSSRRATSTTRPRKRSSLNRLTR
jgi:uncharacterized protein YdaU (DUF1376 family)